MTNGEMLDIFYQKYPELKIEDYRPLHPEMYTKDLIGITIWLKNGDAIQYYPKEAQAEREDVNAKAELLHREIQTGQG